MMRFPTSKSVVFLDRLHSSRERISYRRQGEPRRQDLIVVLIAPT